MPFEAAPIKTSFMLASVIGFLISALWLWKYHTTWAFAFAVLFLLMFIAAMISMRRASPEEQLYPRPKKVK